MNLLGRAPRGPLGSGASGAEWLQTALLALAAVGLGLAVVVFPDRLLLAPVALAAVWALLGTEFLIVVALLTAVGLMPFIDAEDQVIGPIPIWALASAFAFGLMLLMWGVRQLQRSPSVRPPAGALVFLLAILLVYSIGVLGASSPTEIPSLSLPYVTFPAAALVTYLWLSHPEAVTSVRRWLPLVLVVTAAWAAMYVVASATNWGPALNWVSAYSERPGLLGPSSRIYTWGQFTFLGLTLVLLAQMLRRATPVTVGLTLLAFASVALQAFRGQYLAVLGGAVVLLVWKYRGADFGRRALLIPATLVAVAALLVSPVGQRAFTAYEEFQAGSGNVGYRLYRLEESARAWTVFGSGISRDAKQQNFDLGVPNSLLVIGYVGTLIQLAVLVAALFRGLRAGGVAGWTIAAVMAMVLVGRPSLALVEYGWGAVGYGVALGFACALGVQSRGRPALAYPDDEPSSFAEPAGAGGRFAPRPDMPEVARAGRDRR